MEKEGSASCDGGGGGMYEKKSWKRTRKGKGKRTWKGKETEKTREGKENRGIWTKRGEGTGYIRVTESRVNEGNSGVGGG
eukprot:765053-Hanusia_phi.AAC.3